MAWEIEEMTFEDARKSLRQWMQHGAPGTARVLIGAAGTGKTQLLSELAADQCGVAVVAPTGVAALKAGGQTIHSFFHFPPALLTREDIEEERCCNSGTVTLFP